MAFRGDTSTVVLDGDKFLICCKNAGQKHLLGQPPVGPAVSEPAVSDEASTAKEPEVGIYDCQLFCVVGRQKDEACCAACKRFEKSQKRKRESREKDAGNRLAIGSTVNRSYYSFEECQLFIKKQAVEIRRLNRLLPKQAPEPIDNETEETEETEIVSEAPEPIYDETQTEIFCESVAGLLSDE